MKNFFDYNDEKITEKAFSQSLMISVLSILLCIVALCSMTYAWFTGETLSDSNKLMSGSFDVSVSVIKTSEADGTLIENNAAMIALDDGSYRLLTPGIYTVTLTPSEDATVKGYCIVTIDTKVYKTGVILNSEMVDESYTEATAPFTFTIVAGKADAVVTFEPHWGVLVEPDIAEGTIITVNDLSIEIENRRASESLI